MATVAKRKPEGIREIIAGGVARGARAYFDMASSRLEEALASLDAGEKREFFPNTGFYLPVIYAHHRAGRRDPRRYALGAR